MQQAPKLFEIEQLIALYMVNSRVTKVAIKELYNFYDYISTKLYEHDYSLPQSKRLNSAFIFSDFHLRQLNKKSSCPFCISAKNANNDKMISCNNHGRPETVLKELEENVLAVGFSQNAEFMNLANGFAQQYMKEKQIVKEKETKLTPEQNAQRWWDYFGR